MYNLSCKLNVVEALYLPVLFDLSIFVDTDTFDSPKAPSILSVIEEKINSFNAVFKSEPATITPSSELSFPSFLFLLPFPITLSKAKSEIISSSVFPELELNLILGLFIFPVAFISILSVPIFVLASKSTNAFDIKSVSKVDFEILITELFILNSFPFK